MGDIKLIHLTHQICPVCNTVCKIVSKLIDIYGKNIVEIYCQNCNKIYHKRDDTIPKSSNTQRLN